MQTSPSDSLLEGTVQGYKYQEVGIMGPNSEAGYLQISAQKRSKCMCVYRVPTVLQALILGRCNYPHFTGEETEPERLSHRSKVTQ